MSTAPGTNLLIPIVLLLLLGVGARGQTPTPTEWESWPKVQASIELRKQTRLVVYGELENGEEFGYLRWKTGALLNYRTKHIAHRGQSDIDDENEYNLVVGVGYEYLQTIQNGKTKRENRIIVQSTPHHRPGAGLLLQDRNRAEFRWNNGVYDFRYRNRLTVDRAFRVSNFRFTPYASGELFWDRNRHSWNENRYSFGVQLPYKQRLMLDTFYLRQNCTTCRQNPLNVWGVTLNLYFRRQK